MWWIWILVAFFGFFACVYILFNLIDPVSKLIKRIRKTPNNGNELEDAKLTEPKSDKDIVLAALQE